VQPIETLVPLPMAEAEAAVRSALAEQGFGVLTEIDLSGTLLAKLGVDYPATKVLGACNPSLVYQALQVDPDVTLLLPCNVVLTTTAAGTKVRAVDPASLMADPALAALAADAEARLRAALDGAAAVTP
jgi:uncharacterized protein (DUF302 family)